MYRTWHGDRERMANGGGAAIELKDERWFGVFQLKRHLFYGLHPNKTGS